MAEDIQTYNLLDMLHADAAFLQAVLSIRLWSSNRTRIANNHNIVDSLEKNEIESETVYSLYITIFEQCFDCQLVFIGEFIKRDL